MEIWDLFRGFELAHGTFEVRRKKENGKAEGRALTIRGPATVPEWMNHLKGEGPGVGIIPLLEDDTVVWGCIDIDDMSIDHAKLEEQCKALGFPLVIARSKSGGAHCFVFMREPTPAEIIRDSLEAWAAALGYGGCEVFPKQTSRFNEQDLGNWLNMPYYNAHRTIRYAIKDGEPLSATEFIVYAQERMVTAEEVEAVEAPAAVRTATGAPPRTALPANVGIFEDGPPCLQVLEAKHGFPSGTRNAGMFNIAIYLRKRFPDEWENKLQEYNIAMCDPPLGLSELQTICKSISRKEYDYRCKDEPIKGYCHRRACRMRQYGVGEIAEGGGHLEIGHLVKHEGDPVIWFVEVEGKRLMLTTDELLNQNIIKRKILEATNRFITVLPQPRWDRYLNEKLQNCDVVSVPEDASHVGQFKVLVEQYLTGRAQATSREELAHRNTPYNTGEGHIMFRSRGLLEYLSTHGFRYLSEHHVWQMLRDMGAENNYIRAGSKGFNVWILPEPEAPDMEEDLPQFGGVPF